MPTKETKQISIQRAPTSQWAKPNLDENDALRYALNGMQRLEALECIIDEMVLTLPSTSGSRSNGLDDATGNGKLLGITPRHKYLPGMPM